MMKRTGAITILSLLLTAITSSGVVAGQKEVVLDSDGQPVKANTPYYIWRPKERAYISRLGNRTFAPFSCPQRVVLFSDGPMVEEPPPVIFVLASSDDVVRLATELNIKFSRPLYCRESGYWRVVANSSLPIKEVVLSGSKSSYDSTFTIQKFDNESYKFAFGSADNPTDIGLDAIFLRVWRLILSNSSSFGVSFVPA